MPKVQVIRIYASTGECLGWVSRENKRGLSRAKGRGPTVSIDEKERIAVRESLSDGSAAWRVTLEEGERPPRGLVKPARPSARLTHVPERLREAREHAIAAGAALAQLEGSHVLTDTGQEHVRAYRLKAEELIKDLEMSEHDLIA